MNKRRGQTLVATMVVLVIICILAAVYFVGSGGESKRADKMGQTIVGQSILAAKDDKCRIYLGQVRQGLQIQWTTDEAYPATLEETKLGSDFYSCPVGHERYEYDPSTGKVKCVHPGHGNY